IYLMEVDVGFIEDINSGYQVVTGHLLPHQSAVSEKIMLIAPFRKNLLGAVIVAPSILLAGTALAAPHLLEHEQPLSAIGNLDPSSASLPTAIATIEAKTGGTVM